MGEPPSATADATTPCAHKKPHRTTSEKGTCQGSHRRSSNKVCPSRGSRQQLPPPPTQFVIEKQGRFEEDLWHTRVLSLDAPHHRLYLSRAKKAEELQHRCMVRIDAVKLWPTFNSLRIGEPFHSEKAKRTVCIKGLVGVKASAFSFATRLFGPGTSTVPSSSLVGRFLSSKRIAKAEQREETTTPADEPKQPDPQLLPASNKDSACGVNDLSEFSEFATEVWMIRVMTKEDLCLLARALRRTVPDLHVLTGYHRAVESANPSADV
jgi:hypothetical protein